MSSGFQVVIADLQQASATFRAESQTFAAIMPMSCPALPDGGDGAFDQSLSSLMQALDLLHLQIAGSIDNHAKKLQAAHDNYQHTEESLTQLCGQIMDPSKIN
jgi:uncharacterized protein DUF6317